MNSKGFAPVQSHALPSEDSLEKPHGQLVGWASKILEGKYQRQDNQQT